jgi:hypothetical protein
MHITDVTKVTYMEKMQVYLRKEELAALRKAAKRPRGCVAALVREAIRTTGLEPKASDHDRTYDAS